MDSTLKPALLLMSGRSVALGVTFLLPLVFVRIFDQATFGTYKQAFLIYATLYGVAQLGMAESLFYFLPLAPRKGGGYALNAILVIATAGAGCLVLLVAAAGWISQLLSNTELPQHLPALGLFLLFMIASSAFEIIMISRHQYLGAACSYAISDLLRGVFFLLPVLLLRELKWLFVGAVAFGLLRFVATLAYLWREFAGHFRPDAELLKKQLTYALPFHLAGVLGIVQSQFHQYAVSYHFDAATFAIYAVGCLQVPVLEFLTASAGNVMMVRMSEKVRSGQREAVVALWHDTTRKLSLVVFPLVGLLVLVAGDLMVILFTESYSASIPIFRIWSAMLLAAAFQTDGVLRVYATTRFLLVLYGVSVLVVVLFTEWSLAVLGLLGPVLVTVLSVFIGKGMALARIKSLMQTGISQLMPWGTLGRTVAAATAAGLPAVLVNARLETSPLVALGTTGAIYVASYFALLFSLGLVTESEKVAFHGWLRRLGVVSELARDLRRTRR